VGLMFDDDVTLANLSPRLIGQPDLHKKLNTYFFFVCRCCIFGYRKFVAFHEYLKDTSMAQHPSLNSVIALIFEQPCFVDVVHQND